MNPAGQNLSSNSLLARGPEAAVRILRSELDLREAEKQIAFGESVR